MAKGMLAQCRPPPPTPPAKRASKTSRQPERINCVLALQDQVSGEDFSRNGWPRTLPKPSAHGRLRRPSLVTAFWSMRVSVTTAMPCCRVSRIFYGPVIATRIESRLAANSFLRLGWPSMSRRVSLS